MDMWRLRKRWRPNDLEWGGRLLHQLQILFFYFFYFFGGWALHTFVSCTLGSGRIHTSVGAGKHGQTTRIQEDRWS